MTSTGADPLRDSLSHKLMLAFVGTEPPAYLLDWLRTRPVGGFTLFRALNVETPEQVRTLTAQLQQAATDGSQPPLLIAADQEGGQLVALGPQSTAFPGNMALGAARSTDLAEQVGYATGLELRAMGINVNYGPVCDVSTNPANPGLGIRSFGDDPQQAAALAAAMVKGLQRAGVAATLKHFPGIGDISQDTHLEMPVVAHPRERLEGVELVPFRVAAAAGAHLVMSGHFAVPALTGSDEVPATVARAVMQDLLREDMGFSGVTITDALDMGGITQGAGQIIEVLAAVCAGVDLLLLMTDRAVQERVEAGLKLAFSRGIIEEQQTQLSIARILALKQWVGAQPQPELEVVGSSEHRALAQQVTQQALTLVRSDANLLPLHLASDARIAAVMPRPKDLTPADTSSYERPALAAALRVYHPAVDKFITHHPPTDQEIAALRESLASYDLIVLGTLSASMDPQQAALARAVLALGVPVITVALRTPFDLAAYPESSTHICTYSIQQAAVEALAAALWGQARFCGRLPARIPDLYPNGHGLQL